MPPIRASAGCAASRRTMTPASSFIVSSRSNAGGGDRHAALLNASAYSASVVESHVTPPPTPNSARPVAASIAAVRIATLKMASPDGVDESDRAAIHAARRLLDRCDQPHAAALRRAGDRSGRETTRRTRPSAWCARAACLRRSRPVETPTDSARPRTATPPAPTRPPRCDRRRCARGRRSSRSRRGSSPTPPATPPAPRPPRAIARAPPCPSSASS